MTQQEKTELARKGKRGPLPTGKGTQIVVRVHQPMLGALDAACAANDGVTRAEIIRRGMAEWLASKGFLEK